MDVIAVDSAYNSKRVVWNILKRCNYDCLYCWPEAHDNISLIPNIERCIQGFDNLYSKIEPSKVNLTITGGEPFLIKDLPKLLEHIKPKCSYLNILTNGSSSVDKMLKAGKHLDRLSISIHFGETKNKQELEQKIFRLKYELDCDLKIRILNDPLYETDVQKLINSCIGLNIWYELINIVEDFGES